jgi:hypothetical protein
MKSLFLIYVLSLWLAPFVEGADTIGNCTIPEEVLVDGKTFPASTYAVVIEDQATGVLQLLKGNEIMASEPAIVLPAQGPDEITAIVVKTAKHEYVRIRVRHDDSWYVVYLPVVRRPEPGAEHS